MNLVTHLAESTLFAGAVWLATLALRRNHARARHELWMAASLKFLLPLSLFVALGSHAPRHASLPVPAPEMRFVMVEAAPPAPFPTVLPAPRRLDWLTPLLWLAWGCGCGGMLLRWRLRWRAAAARLRGSKPWRTALPVPVRVSPSLLEPAVLGIFRPVLLLPAGIEEHLAPEQLRAILVHELCHIRHRDNLAAAVHMLVEALFWFHPLVWWITARLVDERERACDEEVLELGGDRAIYAESILRVCQLCLESPLPCVSGVTGADLKQRIREILNGNVRPRLSRARNYCWRRWAARFS